MAFKTSSHSGILTTTNIAIAVVILIIIAYVILQSSNAQLISSNKTLTLNTNSSFNFDLPDNSSVASIFLASSSNSSITLYMSMVPVLEKKIMVIYVQKGALVNVSVYGSPYADLQVGFTSGGYKAAQITLAYIPKNLDVRPSALQLLNSTSASQSTTTTISVNTQTTTVQQQTSATTTVFVNKTLQALSEANSSTEGTLMVNYNTLYTKADTQCTPTVYNTTYIEKHSYAPTGPNTYANVTVAVPTSIFATITPISSTIYNITYTAVIPIGNLPAMTMQINSTSKAVISYGFVGIFEGDSFTTALQQYQALNASTNPCSPYVP